MGRWDRTCNTFRDVRAALEEYVETFEHCMEIMKLMKRCCDEVIASSTTDWEFCDDFEEFRSDIEDEIELMDKADYESCEDIVNSYLMEMYDLCDYARVWLAT